MEAITNVYDLIFGCVVILCIFAFLGFILYLGFKLDKEKHELLKEHYNDIKEIKEIYKKNSEK